MSERLPAALRLLAAQVIVLLIGLGVFFAFLLGAVVSEGGVATIDMTRFGEKWIEYWLMVGLVSVTPWALFWLDRQYRLE